MRLAASVSVSVGALLLSGRLADTQLLKNSADVLSASPLPSSVTNRRASLITVKAYYTMMAQYTDLSEEDFVLQCPAALQDLMNTCVVRHPSMAQMMGTMLILLDGAPSKPSASLRDGDIVQFIALTAGG